jgi:hypothetical protein
VRVGLMLSDASPHSALTLIWQGPSSTHWLGLQGLFRYLVVNGIGWDLHVARSTLLQDVLQDSIESLCPDCICDWRHLIQERLRNGKRF